MKIKEIKGRGLAIRGNDIDTDRILPARYMKALTFAGVEKHLFENERALFESEGRVHPTADPRFAGASILFVNANFGCGSSREHAPQSLLRHGVRAIVAESFGEIFAGNCASIGVVPMTAEAGTVERLQALCEADAQTEFSVSILEQRIEPGGWPLGIAHGLRRRFLDGSWDTLSWLLRATVVPPT